MADVSVAYDVAMGLGAALAGFLGGKHGGQRGASDTLNGTKSDVREIKGDVKHLLRTTANTAERVAALEARSDGLDARLSDALVPTPRRPRRRKPGA